MQSASGRIFGAGAPRCPWDDDDAPLTAADERELSDYLLHQPHAFLDHLLPIVDDRVGLLLAEMSAEPLAWAGACYAAAFACCCRQTDQAWQVCDRCM